MKRNILYAAVCLGIVMAMPGCTAPTQDTVAEESTAPFVQSETEETSAATTEAATETTTAATTTEATTAETEATTRDVVRSDGVWSLMAEKEISSSSHVVGYRDDKFALNVGYGGKILFISDAYPEWTDAENNSMCRMGMDIVNSTCYTCGNAGQITKSVDGGMSFTRVADFGMSVPNECRLMSFCDENTGIIAAKKKLAITTDGAESWTELTAPAEITAIRMQDKDTFYIVSSDFTLYKTTDGGSTWENVPMNLPLGNSYDGTIRKAALAIDGDNAYTVYCVEKDSFTMKSYSTTDNWADCVENTLPDVKLYDGVIYLNRSGDILTLTDTEAKIATAIKKESK